MGLNSLYHGFSPRNNSVNSLDSEATRVDSGDVDNDCMTTTDACLTFVQRISGFKPKLLSFRSKANRSRRSHPVTGQPFKVPNIVHLISFGDKQPFSFYNYVGFKSFDKYLSPLGIFLWADHPPADNATWWKKTLQEVANVYFLPIVPVRHIGGRKVSYIAHAADYLRLQLITSIFIYLFIYFNIILYHIIPI